MKQYKELVEHVLKNGELRENRTGINTLSVFGHQSRYDLRDGFPLLTTKKVNFNSVLKELLWFLSGSTNIKDLGCGIWDEWADKNGEVGKIYGYQWRHWNKFILDGLVCQNVFMKINIDQMSNLIEGLKTNPNSRRHIVSAWNVSDLANMALPPCHILFQCYVSDSGFIDLQFYQRSADIALGVPFNIASYSLLLMMLAQECGYTPRFLIHSIGDAHIYVNHVDGLKEQITRDTLKLPTVEISEKPFFELRLDDFALVDYEHHQAIKFDVAV
jgi:thymidylate synthase